MTIMVSKLAATFLWRNMIKSMSLLLSYFFFDHLPSTSCFMSLFCWMSTATTKAVMLHSYSVFCLFKGKTDFFTSKDISVEVFAENLGCLIVYFILRINHDHILRTCFIKYFADDLWMTWVNKNKSWNRLFLRKKYLSNFLSIYCTKWSDREFRIIFKL